MALGRELKEYAPGSPCGVIPHTAGVMFLRQNNTFKMASARGEAIAQPTGITLPHSVVFKPYCWRIYLEDFHSLSLIGSL